MKLFFGKNLWIMLISAVLMGACSSDAGSGSSNSGSGVGSSLVPSDFSRGLNEPVVLPQE